MAAIGFPTNALSEPIYYNNTNVSGVTATITSTGTTRFWVGHTDVEDTDIVWEELTRTALTGTQFNFTSTGKYVYWKAIGNPGSTITLIKIKMVI